MFDTLKRKNDDKAKSHAGRRAIFVGIVAFICLGIVALIVWTSPKIINPQFPNKRLFYTSGGYPYAINLQTGERAEAAWPALTPQPDDPAEIREVDALISTGEYRDFTSSPNNQWWIGWKNLRNQWELELMLYDRTGNQPPRSLGIFYGVFHGSRISWSSDSQWITFSAQPPPNDERRSSEAEEIWLMPIATGELRRLTINDFRDSMPDFSPDGMQIVYTSAANGYLHLYIMDLDTLHSRLLTPELYGYSAVWSPDGQWIAFRTDSREPKGDIWLIRPDGTDAQLVITSDKDDANPIWLPPDA